MKKIFIIEDDDAIGIGLKYYLEQENFIVKLTTTGSEALDKIKLDKTNMYVAIDFDKTITATESEDSWVATGKMLGKEFETKLSNLYKKYRPIELNYQITFEEKNKAMENWYQECMNLYYEYHLTKDKLEKSIQKSNLIFRSGAK